MARNRVGMVVFGLVAAVLTNGRSVEAGAVEVGALTQAATNDRSDTAAYLLWKHYFTLDQRDTAAAWWNKMRENALFRMALAASPDEKGAVEARLVGHRIGRVATVLALPKSATERRRLLTQLRDAEPNDAWLLRGGWQASEAAHLPLADVDADWTAAASAIDGALSSAETARAKTVVADRRLECYHLRVQTLDTRPDSVAQIKTHLDKMGTLMAPASTFARAFHARQIVQRYARIRDWPKTVEWAKKAAEEHLALYADDRNREADMSVAYALNACAAAAETSAGMEPILRPFADWAASWVEAHPTLQTQDSHAAIFRACDAVGDYAKGDQWHRRYLALVIAQIAKITDAQAREARWSAVETIHR